MAEKLTPHLHPPCGNHEDQTAKGTAGLDCSGFMPKAVLESTYEAAIR